MTGDIILAIDQGTTSTRSMSFGRDGVPRHSVRREFAQHYPAAGWVEHDPEDIWRDTLATLTETAAADSGRVAAIGITNQRETLVVWDRATGEAVYNAIVWQDRRGAALCARLKAEGCEPLVRARTGLLLDPYFTATKLKWILDEIPGVRERADRGELAAGTIDVFLLWRLTGGRIHATDASNASRTMLFDIHRGVWDEELLRLFTVPASLLPEVRDNAAEFGETNVLGRPTLIGGMAGDQQAAAIGQACFARGDVKSTYGTGCFLLLNTGEEAVASAHGLLTTIAYRLNGRMTYALEGSIFVAGAAIKWLRDGIGIITHAADTHDLATRLDDNHGVYMVPAFVGLGAPHWDPAARATISGLTLDATGAHLARAALESVAYQTADLIAAMEGDFSGDSRKALVADGARDLRHVRVDGGMAANDWFCQFLADMLDTEVARPANIETTAAGAAFLAGMTAGIWSGTDDIAASWRADRIFKPEMTAEKRAALNAGWQDAVARTLSR